MLSPSDYLKRDNVEQKLAMAVSQVLRERPASAVSRIAALLQEAESPSSESTRLTAGIQACSLKNEFCTVRPIKQEDVPAAANVCQEAFNAFNARVGLPPEFPPIEVFDVPSPVLIEAVKEDAIAGFVAIDSAGAVIGSNRIDFRDPIAAIGPISIDPKAQGKNAGKLLMQAVMKEAALRKVAPVRLMQIASNTVSYSLYHALGFDTVAHYGEYIGYSTAAAPEGFTCAKMTDADVGPCSKLCEELTGYSRDKDIGTYCASPVPNCVVRDSSGQIVAYTTGLFTLGHTCARSEDGFKALIVHMSAVIKGAQAAGAPVPPPNMHVSRTGTFMARWLTSNGFRLNRAQSMMVYGPFTPLSDMYCPSVLW